MAYATRPRRAEDGSALVELAVALPLLVMLLLGVTDFGRAFYTGIALTNAARTGAQWGSASTPNSAQTDPGGGINTTAVNSVNSVGITVISTRTCACATDDGTSIATVSCDATCAPGQHLASFVTVTASKQFNTVTRFPGLPNTIFMTRQATMRVVN